MKSYQLSWFTWAVAEAEAGTLSRYLMDLFSTVNTKYSALLSQNLRSLQFPLETPFLTSPTQIIN
jgi:hypothetical protein